MLTTAAIVTVAMHMSVADLPPDAPPASDPQTILQASAEACRVLRSARYHALWEVQDDRTPQRLEGDVTFLRWPAEPDPAPLPPPAPNEDGAFPAIAMVKPRLKTLFDADLRVDRGDGESRTFNHDRAAVWNPNDNSFRVMASADGGEQLVISDATVMLLATPLLQSESLSRLAAPANQLTLGMRENVHGVECAIVTARLPKPDAKSDIIMNVAIGVADHLPRRTVFEQFTDGQSALRHTVTISNLQPNVQLDSATFALEAPQGVIVETVKAEPPPKMLAAGEVAPDFTLKNPDGRNVSLADFHGKVVLIDFWGTWCGPCKMAMPAIQSIHSKYRDKEVVVIGISCREKPDADPARVMRELGCDYGLLLNGETIAKQWHVPGYPTLYVIDQHGRIADAHLGFDEDLESRLGTTIDGLLQR